MAFLKLVMLVLLSSSFLFAANTGKVAVTDTGTVASLNALVVSKAGQSVTYQITRPCTIGTNLDMPKTFRINGIINNSWVYVNPGVMWTIRNCTENLPDSCIRGSGTVLFDTCATSFFDTRWIGSSALSYTWRGCNGDTVRFTSFQANTAGIGAANITQSTVDSVRGRTGRFDSLQIIQQMRGNLVGNVTGNATTVTNGVYVSGSYDNPSWITGLSGSKITGNLSMDSVFTTALRCTRLYSTSNISASSITAARLTLQTDSLYSNLKIPGVSTHALLDVGTMLIHSGKYNNPTGNIYNNVDYNNGPYSAYPGRSHRLRMSGSSIYLSISPSAAAAGESVSFYDLARIDSLYSWLRGPVAINKNSAAASGYALDVNGRILAGDRITLKDLYTDNYARIYTQAATPGGNNSIWIDSLVTANTIVLNRRKMYGSGTSDTIAEIEQIRDCYHIRGGNPWYDGLGAVTNSYIDNFKSISADSGRFRTIVIDTRVDTARSAERADWSDEAYYSQTAGEAEIAQGVYLGSNVYISSDDSVKVNALSGIELYTGGDINITGSNVNISGNVEIEDPVISGKATIDSISVRRVYTRSVTFTNGLRNTAATSIDIRGDHQSFVTLQGTGDWSFIADPGTLLFIESNAPSVRVYRVSNNSGTAYSVASGTCLMMICRYTVSNVSTWSVFRDTDS